MSKSANDPLSAAVGIARRIASARRPEVLIELVCSLGQALGADYCSVGEIFETDFTFDCLLTRQDYTLTVATQYREGFSQDWLDDVLSFSVVDSRDLAGLASLKTKVEWRRVNE